MYAQEAVFNIGELKNVLPLNTLKHVFYGGGGGGGGTDASVLICPAVTSPAEAKFLAPYWGDTVDSGKVLSYQPAILCSLAGRYDNSMPE
jgi:hypothetical protein